MFYNGIRMIIVIFLFKLNIDNFYGLSWAEVLRYDVDCIDFVYIFWINICFIIRNIMIVRQVKEDLYMYNF